MGWGNRTQPHTHNHTCTNTHSSGISLNDKSQPEAGWQVRNKPASVGSSEMLFGRWWLVND